MTKDYAKYVFKKAKPRPARYVFYGALSLVFIGLLIVWINSKKTHSRSALSAVSMQHSIKEKKIASKLTPTKPSEPEFDFYNILPEEGVISPLQSNKELSLSNHSNEKTKAYSLENFNDLINQTPEQEAMAEAKKQLDQEMNQLNHDA